MAITRFENISVNRVTNGIDTFGQQTTTTTLWFQTRALVHSVKNSLNINKDERIYTDLVNFKVNYTPNTKEIVDNQNLYSILWRSRAWRIDSAVEGDDRMSVTFYCYRNDPVVPV
jgi:hypothetical protein